MNEMVSVVPSDILAGLGLATRRELCFLLATLESIEAFGLAQGAVENIAHRLRMIEGDASERISVAAQAFVASDLSNDILRHRLWCRLTDGLGVPTLPPLSRHTVRRSGAALAVRTAERLSPAIARATQVEELSASPDNEQPSRGWSAAKKLAGRAVDRFRPTQALPFPEIVQEEILRLFADPSTLDVAAQSTDPAVREALRRGHGAAQKALAAGGSWTIFAAVVANAGFAPYILAAQLSAWIPFVGGPALVSFLAVLVNPATLLVGLAGMAWLAGGRGVRVVRSQIAARFCVLLAARGAGHTEEGVGLFLQAMRGLGSAAAGEMGHLAPKDRAALRGRLAAVTTRLRAPLPRPAGLPPRPWNARPAHRRPGQLTDVVDALAVAGLTAGEMLWHAAAVDPNVLRAADFSRIADLGDPLSFAAHAQDFALAGAGLSLRGYVAERLVHHQLIADGHDVVFPPHSNTPGYDLIVDGHSVQVKCTEGLDLLREHFRTYPDIPVIANGSVAALASASDEPWRALVTTVLGFDVGEIEGSISDALGHAASLADPDLLHVALSIGLLRGGIEVCRGRVPLDDLPGWLVVDGASRGALALLGGQGGTWLGLIVIGPAGALILGPVLASAALLGTGYVRHATEKLLLRD